MPEDRHLPAIDHATSQDATGPSSPTPASPVERLLIPVDTGHDSMRGVLHALARKSRGYRVEVVLLHVIEDDPQWQIRRFRSENHIRAFRESRANAHCSRLAAPLREAGVPVRIAIRSGDPAFAILDAAEELDCQSIIVPRPMPQWLAWLFRDTVGTLLRRARDVPVMPLGPSRSGFEPRHGLMAATSRSS